ncbi:RdgB/HAM1 family non-canonical purine NTP pyrophosphatase [Rariglobus hedericola]
MNALAQASGLDVEIISAKEVGGMPAVVEDTGTFIGNARKKALALKAMLPADAWVLADDSGLCVDALSGAPGVESAYYAGPQGDSAANLTKLVEVMKGVPIDNRGAHFICILLLAGPQNVEHVIEGRCEGRLLSKPEGGAGFGYDPLFVPQGYEESFSRLGDEAKNIISHRARAWAGLTEIIKTLDCR